MNGWAQRIAVMPKWLVLATMVAAVMTDLSTLMVGALLLNEPPLSIIRATHSTHVTQVWALMLIGGSLAALAGAVTFRIRLQVFGLCLTAGAMFVWALAAVTQPHPSLTNVGVSFAFAALFYALGWRILGLFAGIFIRRAR